MVGAAAVPVSVAAVEDADRGTRLGVEVLDQAISQAAGVNGFAFRVMSPSEPLRSSASDELPVEVGVDVSGLVGVYGGNFADRLQVVALPACALVSPRPAGCDASGAVMASSRSKDDPDLLVVDVSDLNDLVAVGLEGDVPVPDDAAGATPGVPGPGAPSAGVPGSGPSGPAAPAPTDTDGAAPADGAESSDDPPVTAPETGPAAPDTTNSTTGPDATTEAAPEDSERAPEETTSTTTAAPFGPTGAEGEADAAAPAGSEQSAVVLAVTAGPEGEAGTYKATPFSHSSEWEAGVGTGEFSWSYPIRVPAPAGGAAPSVAASYSSGSVDGMVTTANTQAGALGLGWADFANAFVERRYATCKDEGVGGGDLCWRNDNATLSLNGRASELVPVDGTFRQWRLRDDPNWRVERFDSSDGALPYNDDANDERWRVTTPDGTEYWFGLAPMWTPGSPDCESGAALETSAFVPADRCDPESVWTVPVWGDDPGDACYLAPPAINLPCRQAWRWNLDYVIDPNDNVTAYAYQEEQNRYLVAGGFLGADWYSRGGTLDQIAYGRRLTGTGRGTHTVTFWTDERCSTFPESGCPLLNPKPPAEGGNADLFPDVPSDLVCGPTATCTATSPTFFSTHRYFGLSVGLPSFGTVDEYRFFHTFADDGFGNKKLWLTGIQRTGWSGAPTGMVMPQVNFLGSPKPNRIDIGGVPSKAMPHHRLELIVDEFGRWTVVTYGQQNPCPTNPWPTGNWDTNTADCYPQSWVPPGATTPVFTVFHKYLVTKVEVRDPISPATDDVVTDYLYEGPAAWHHADDEFVPNARQTWSAWRGYERTKVTTGNQVSRVQVFRGMNGDRLARDPENGPGTRAATVTPVDGSSLPVADDNWLAGRVIYEEQLSGSTRVVKTLRTYTSHETAVRPGEVDPQDAARWVGPAATTESRADGGAFKQRRTTTSYNAQRLPNSVYEEGWLDDPNDNRCTRRSYSVNSPLFMLDYPQVSVIVSGNCLSSTEVRRTQTAYDGQAVGVAPTRGNPTSIQSRIDSATWNQPQTTTYDELGRPLVVTNPSGHTTTTTYIPATGIPSATEVRNHLQQVSRTDWNRVLGMPASETDPNGKVTSFEYDALGRTTKVFLPTEQGVTTPSHRFSYHIDPERDGPAIVHAEQLQSTSPERYLHSWTLYDANLREQQTQTLSPATGMSIVSQSIYDNVGRRTAQTSPQALPYTGFPGIGFLTPAGGWANTTLTGYDALGRPTSDVYFTGSQVRWTTERAYGANTVTVTPPSGARVRTTTDAYDRTAKVEEEESLNGGTWRATSYTYNAGDDLLTITDPAGNRITNTYDMLGRRTALDDPDAGDWTFGYDAAGNEIRTTDARGVQLHTTYDALNRPRQRHRDTPTGPLLAEWLYDAPGEAGLLNKTVRYDGTGQWTVDVTGYDARSRPTGKSWTVPAGIPGISGGSPVTFGPVTYGYDRADHMTSIGYPAVGGLPAETVTIGYNSTGQPETMVGAEQYVWAGNYDDRGRPFWFVGGSQTTPFSRIWSYDGDQRLARVQAAGGSTVMLDHTLSYDNSGNITDRATVLNGQTWRECFGYDGRQRLTRCVHDVRNLRVRNRGDRCAALQPHVQLQRRRQPHPSGSGVDHHRLHLSSRRADSSPTPCAHRGRRFDIHLGHQRQPGQPYRRRPAQHPHLGCRTPLDAHRRSRRRHEHGLRRGRRPPAAADPERHLPLHRGPRDHGPDQRPDVGRPYLHHRRDRLRHPDPQPGRVPRRRPARLRRAHGSQWPSLGADGTRVPAVRPTPGQPAVPDGSGLDQPDRGRQHRPRLPERPLLRPQHRTVHLTRPAVRHRQAADGEPVPVRPQQPGHQRRPRGPRAAAVAQPGVRLVDVHGRRLRTGDRVRRVRDPRGRLQGEVRRNRRRRDPGCAGGRGRRRRWHDRVVPPELRRARLHHAGLRQCARPRRHRPQVHRQQRPVGDYGVWRRDSDGRTRTRRHEVHRWRHLLRHRRIRDPYAPPGARGAAGTDPRQQVPPDLRDDLRSRGQRGARHVREQWQARHRYKWSGRLRRSLRRHSDEQYGRQPVGRRREPPSVARLLPLVSNQW